MMSVRTLAEVEPWCLEAKVGDEAAFSVGESLSQDEVSAFAFQVNQKLTGHVWIHVHEERGLIPNSTTILHIRCSY